MCAAAAGSLTVAFSDSNDGHGWRVKVERPFYSLDTRWSFGTALQHDQTVEPVYRLGERVAGYGRQTEFGGSSLRADRTA